MRTIEKTLFTFEELSDSAKETARENWRANMDFAWSDESIDSIKAFCEYFNVTLTDWRVGAYEPFDYETNAENRHFRGVKLKTINRDSMPTGYCLDCDLWFTFYDEFKRTGDAKNAFDDAIYAGFKAWRDDMEYQLSDESIDESLTINEYEFYENGEMV